MQKVETIIIGGGVSGLACGRTLHQKGRDFLLLTEEIGGRMLTSRSHKVNYGASYITEDYKNVLPFMGGGKRIWTHDCYFHDGNRPLSFYRLRNLLEIGRIIRLYRIVNDFRKRLAQLRQKALTQPQKDALASDHVLREYTNKPAIDFVRENHLQYLNKVYFAPLFNSTGFIEYDKCNTFAYLDNLLALFRKTYVADHSRCCHLLPAGWREKIKICRVEKLTRITGSKFEVMTDKGLYTADNVVLALPFHAAKGIYKVPEPEHNIPIYVLEVEGKRNHCCRHKKVVFFQPEKHDITILWRQTTGTDVIFSKVEDPDLNQYYTRHRLVNKIFWPTAVVLSGAEWCPQDLHDNLYLASDYNICGLEDAFITGVYAANRISG